MGSFRVEKLASIIREIVGDAIANKLHDPRISPMTSVSRVEVSPDLQVAKIHVTVLGESAQGRRTLAGLTNAVGRVQGLLAARLTIRRCPQILFLIDDSLKKAAEMTRIIDEARRQDHSEFAGEQFGPEGDDRPALEGGVE